MKANNYNKVIVLVLSYNGKYLLDECLTSYTQNSYKNKEIVVIDNGSTDNTKQYVEENYPSVKVLRTEVNLKYSGGFNFGFKYAFDEQKCDYVLVTNNDIKADRELINELVKVAETNDRIGFVTGKVYYYDEPNVLQTVGKKEHPILWSGGHIGNKEEDKGQYDEVCERYFADDVFTLVRKQLYDDIGGYDTIFEFQSEEYDWQARAKEKGYKIMYTPFAKLWHKESMTIGKASAFKLYYDAKNPFIVVMKHKSPEFIRKYFWYHLKNSIVLTSLVSIKRLNFKVLFAVWRGFLSAIIWGIRQRKLRIV